MSSLYVVRQALMMSESELIRRLFAECQKLLDAAVQGRTSLADLKPLTKKQVIRQKGTDGAKKKRARKKAGQRKARKDKSRDQTGDRGKDRGPGRGGCGGRGDRDGKDGKKKMPKTAHTQAAKPTAKTATAAK